MAASDRRLFRLDNCRFFYALLPVLALTSLRLQPNGLWLVSWIVAVTAATDIGAFFSGRLIGGAKICPALSPKKTWSGLIGGMIAAAITAYFIADFGQLPSVMKIAGAPMAVVAQAGDFFESWLKRRANVKDSGNLLPGHGGIMDRVDGLLPVALLTDILIKIGAFL
nr:phosphatidate cytidylyltransferase [Zymomonas mobilis]